MKKHLEVLRNAVGVLLMAALGAAVCMAALLPDWECRAILERMGLL